MNPREIETLLHRFEEAWTNGRAPRLEEFLPAASTGQDRLRRELLEELVPIDLDYRWQPANAKAAAGRLPSRPRLEDYLKCYPELGRVEQLTLELVAEEYRVRRRRGDQPADDEYTSRFPHLGPKLRETLAAIDRELSAERPRDGQRLAAASAVIAAAAPEPAQPVTTSAALMELLRKVTLLNSQQLDEAMRLQARLPDPRALAKELLQRGWLTPYQVNQLLQGRGAELVIGQYLLLERLGEGGTGQVFKARHQSMNRVVALKVIRRDLLSDNEVVQRFYREIRVISQLSHPNVVHAYDAGPIGSAHVLVMEYIPGTDLDRLVKQSGPLPVNEACEYVHQAALGLQHAHERGLVHRDIKPSNLLLSLVPGPSSLAKTGNLGAADKGQGTKDKGQIVKVLDLGLARLQRNPLDENETSVLTPTGAVMIGTPNFLAPEQAIDFHAADIRADIYGLGCTLYYLLTGQPPFPGGTLAQKLLKHQQAPPPAVEKLRPEASPELVDILNRMLAKRPEDRYQVPVEVADALAPFCGPTASPRRRPLLPLRRLRAWLPGRRGRIAAAVGAALLLAVIGLAWLRPFGGRPSSATAASAAAALDDLRSRWNEPGARRDELRRAVVDFRVQYPGTPQAREATLWLTQTQLQSVLDQLDRTQVPPSKPLELLAIRGRALPPSPKGGCLVAFSPGGQWLARTSEDGKFYLWDLLGGKEQAHDFPGKNSILSVAFSPDGNTLVIRSADRCFFWDLHRHSGRNLDAAQEGITALAFAPNGKALATGGKTGNITLWDTDRWLQTARYTHLHAKEPVHCLEFSPDGQTLASTTVSLDKTTKVWAAESGKLRHTLDGKDRGAISTLAFSPDGRSIATATDRDDKVRIWDVATGQERGLVEQLSKVIVSVEYTPDGKNLVVLGRDGWVTVTREDAAPRDRRRLNTDSQARSLALAPDGRHLAFGNSDSTLYILRPTFVLVDGVK